MDEGVLKISNPDDRAEVAKLLFRNGYSVRLKKRKVGKKVVYDLHYWMEDDDED